MAITINDSSITFNDGFVQTIPFSLTVGHAFTCQLCFSTGYTVTAANATSLSGTATLAFCTPGQVCAPTLCTHYRNFEVSANQSTGSTVFYNGNPVNIGCLIMRVGSANVAAWTTTASFSGSHFLPSPNNTHTLGSTTLRWAEIWVTGGSLIVSDKNLKTDITLISVQEKAVALEIKRNLKRYKLKDAVLKKGFEEARYHFGCIAQEVEQIFQDGGLDPFQYGVIGCDEVYEMIDPITQERKVSSDPIDGYIKTLEYSVRYDEILSFIASAL
jgi:hypothetical protein